MNKSRSSRRDFLQASAGIVAAGTAAPYFWSSSQAKAESKNDRFGVAAIGVGQVDPVARDGGRGSYNGHRAAGFGNMVACCDVDRTNAEVFASRYDGKCQIHGDYRSLLERKDVDVVTIGTPDHWHTPIAVAAMKAGKDVFCEKPLTLTVDEGKLICRVAKDTGRVFQVGTQQRSEYDNMFLKAVALVQSGRLGKKLTVTCSMGPPPSGGPFKNEAPPKHLNWDFWLGPAPKVPYCPKRGHYWFRYWMEYTGGEITNWGVHHVDIAQWALGHENSGPVEVEGTGEFAMGRETMLNVLLGKKPVADLPNSFNTPSKFDVRLTFEDGNKIIFRNGPNGILFEGENGRIFVNRRRLTGKPIEELTDVDKEWLDQEVINLYKGKQPGNHMQNFFECVKDRSQPISDVFTHHRIVTSCHLSNIAMLFSRKLRWDPAKEDFVGDEEASKMLSRRQREPYTIERLT